MESFKEALTNFSSEIMKSLDDTAEKEFIVALSEAKKEYRGENQIRVTFTVRRFAFRKRPDISNFLVENGWSLTDDDEPVVHYTKIFS